MVSDAFKSVLKRHLSDNQTILDLAQSYPKDYPELSREEGVSFNPLSARLTDIAVRIGLSEDQIIELLRGAKEATLTKIDPIKKLPPELASVWVIDALRHFKMSGLDRIFAESILSIPTNNHPMILKAKEQYAKIIL
jgi:hypothetical protein